MVHSHPFHSFIMTVSFQTLQVEGGALPFLTVINTKAKRKHVGEDVHPHISFALPHSSFFCVAPCSYTQGQDMVIEVGHIILGKVIRITTKQVLYGNHQEKGFSHVSLLSSLPSSNLHHHIHPSSSLSLLRPIWRFFV